MLLSIVLPESTFRSLVCVVRAVHVSEGIAVEPGSKIIDISVDLSAGQSYACAPIAHYRVAAMESGLLMQVGVAVGQEITTATMIGLLRTLAEAASAEPARPARIAVASILHQEGWWDEF